MLIPTWMSFGVLRRVPILLNDSLSTANFLECAVSAYGDHTFLEFDDALNLDRVYTSVTFSELIHIVNRSSNVLRNDNLSRCERVSIFKNNAFDYFIYGMAAIRAGGIAVPINGGMSADAAIDYLNYVGTTVLITDCAHYDLLAAENLRERCPSLRTIYLSDGERSSARDIRPLLTDASTAFDSISRYTDEHILIVHTSGTTGTPKGVLHTEGSYISGLKRMFRLGVWLPRKFSFILVLPFNHFIAYQVVAANLIGGLHGMIACDPSPDAILNHIASFRPDVFFSFPHCYVAMYGRGLGNIDLSSIKIWMAGADSSHEAHIREFVQHGSLLKLFGRTIVPSVFIDTLGSSEVGFPAFNRVSTRYTRLFSRCIGRTILGGPKVKVADEHGRKLAATQIGRLMVKGPTLFTGYWNAHDRVHGEVINEWWWTGDLGYRDRLGRYFHIDRSVDTVTCGETVVSSLLLEEHILKFPGVVEAVVVAKDLSLSQKIPFAFIQFRPNAKIEIDQLRDWVKKGLPSSLGKNADLFDISIVDELDIPRGLTGKVLKRELRRRLNAA